MLSLVSLIREDVGIPDPFVRLIAESSFFRFSSYCVGASLFQSLFLPRGGAPVQLGSRTEFAYGLFLLMLYNHFFLRWEQYHTMNCLDIVIVGLLLPQADSVEE